MTTNCGELGLRYAEQLLVKLMRMWVFRNFPDRQKKGGGEIKRANRSVDT